MGRGDGSPGENQSSRFSESVERRGVKMRKMRLMPITKCHGCVFRSTMDCKTHYCQNQENGADREIHTNIFIEIPEWCELEIAGDKK
jgi:hypothetical protein